VLWLVSEFPAQEMLPVNTWTTNGICVSPKWNIIFNLLQLP
jgi:hypothetical protein